MGARVAKRDPARSTRRRAALEYLRPPMRIWLVLAICLAATPALAQEPSPADALVTEGLELRREGRDAEALERFTQAYEASSSPRALAQMGLAEQALGRWLDAERHLDQAIAAEDAWIAERRPLLTEALSAIRGRLASVEASASVEGAELYLNGAAAGVLPLAAPVRVVAGPIELEVRAEGHRPLRRTIEARGGQLVREHFELAAIEAPPAPAPEPEVPIAAPPPAPAPASARGPLWTSGAIVAGVAALAIVSAGVAMGIREEDAQAFASDGCLPAAGTRFEACQDRWARGHAAEDAAIGLFVTAGAFAAGASVLFAIGASEPDPSQASLTCAPSIGGAVCAGRF